MTTSTASSVPSIAPDPLQKLAEEALKRAGRHHREGRLAEAVAAYDEALAVAPDRLSALVNKGVALRAMKRVEEALACYWQALAAHPDNDALWCNAANALIDLNRLPEAEAALRVAVARMPRMAEVWVSLGALLTRRKQPDAAIACLRRALSLAPDNFTARAMLASSLSEQGEVGDSIAAFRHAIELAPGSTALHSGLGQALTARDRFDEAEAHLRRALTLDGNCLDAHLGLARLLFLKGDLGAAWPEYEWRRRKSGAKFPKLIGPEWDGSNLRGKSILVYSEQGLGDVLHFIRYVPLLAERGARVIVGCPASMIGLLEGMPGVSAVHAEWRRLPAHDFHVPLLSLPGLMGTTAETIPAAVPYLKAPSGAPVLRAPLGTRLKVGLVWAGSATHASDADRSMTLEAMLPLTGIAGIAFYSLQVGPRAADLAKLAHPALIGDAAPKLRDYAATAGVVEQLDLVITVDTSVAHLAGALGKPVWVLIQAAPEWRWQTGREDSPWYPTMRLFRQEKRREWASVIERVAGELRLLLERYPAQPEGPPAGVESVFPAPDGAPRYRMSIPRDRLSDPGVRFLVNRERAGIGYEYATRAFLDAHLRPGDLFIDVGAHWGVMSLHAATRWPGQVAVLALEPLPGNLPHLRGWLEDNRVAGQVEIVAAAASDKPGKGKLRPESTMGHRLERSGAGPVPVVTVDGLLADRPALRGRRVIVKIDVEGTEADVIAGMEALLASGDVAAIIWERGVEYESADGQKRLKRLRKRLDKLGFTAWRFASEDGAGSLEPFVEQGKTGNVIELAPGVEPAGSYGLPRPHPVAQPDDRQLDEVVKAQDLVRMGLQLQGAGKTREAMNVYAVAAALDSRLSALYNNLGVALRGLDRLAAAAASYRRALDLSPRDPAALSNLGNVLREMGQLDEAEALQARAVDLSPQDPGLLFNLGTVKRDQGDPRAAAVLFERALAKRPDNEDYKWDRALSLLQQGNYSEGFPAYESRWGLPRNQARKKIALPFWDGSDLAGRNIFLHDEQGFGDVLQFARFIPLLKARGAGKVVLECQPELMRLMAAAPGVDAVIPRGPRYAICDVYAPLLSLPAILGTTLENLPAACPYLAAPEPLRRLDDDGRLKVGLVWAGSKLPRDRSVPLQRLLPALAHPGIQAYSLQLGPRAADLKAVGADLLIQDLGPVLSDFAETAAMLRQLDLLVSIDTSIVHLAGALGVPAFVLLRYTSDWRWFDSGSHSPWYPSLTLFRQAAPDRWDEALAGLERAVAALAEAKRR